MGDRTDVKAIAERHGFSEGAARALADALRAGGGTMAQFSHPELGGMGQWSRGGMLMIGAMNDHDLKARVARLADDLAAYGVDSGDDRAAGESRASEPPAPKSTSPWARDDETSGEDRPASARQTSGGWWPGDLGQPSASGSQNGVRYAAFADARRLAIEEGGKVSLYDTGDHSISGVSQSQSGGGPGSLRFTSQRGDIDLASLTRL